ncbi:MAG: MBL fold metallo-hydrolase [Parvularculales bacterium]
MVASIPFVRDINFEYGRCDRLSPLIRRVIANNPGPFTYTGTGTYIIGEGEVAVIDPGPLLDEHIDAIMAALGPNERITHIPITHTHSDHSPAAAPLKERTSALTCGFGAHGQKRSSDETVSTHEEGIDGEFTPDVIMQDGDSISGAGWTLEAVHTPGHTSNHLCFALREEKALFSGDHVMGWSTSVIGPPDGNMQHYMASLQRLLLRDDVIFWPTHGPPITDPKNFVQAFIAHREEREAQIMARLEAGDNLITDIVAALYQHVDKRLHGAAAYSVLAHMEHLVAKQQVLCEDTRLGLKSHYRLP